MMNSQHNRLLEIKKADSLLLEIKRASNVITEAIDNETLTTAGKIIEKLRKLKGKGSKALDSAIDDAESQLNKYTAGGTLTKAWTKMKGLVGFDNPLIKVMTFANALETGFKQMPTIIKNATDADLNASVDKSLNQIVTDISKQRTMTNNMLRALSPKGIWGAFKNVPYTNKEALVQDLLNLPLKNFAAITQILNAGPSTQQVVDDVKQTAKQTGDAESRTTEPTSGTEQTKGTEGTKSTTTTTKTTPTTNTGSTPDRKQKTNSINNIYDELSIQLLDIVGSEQKAKAFLKLLSDEDFLK